MSAQMCLQSMLLACCSLMVTLFSSSCCMMAMFKAVHFLSCNSWLIAGAYISLHNAKINTQTVPIIPQAGSGWLLGGSERGAGAPPDTRLPLKQPEGQLIGHVPQGSQALLNTLLR